MSTAKLRRRAARQVRRRQQSKAVVAAMLRAAGHNRGCAIEDRHRDPLEVKGTRTRLRTLINRLTPQPERGPRPKYSVDFRRRAVAGARSYCLAIIVRQGTVVALSEFEGYPVVGRNVVWSPA